MCKTDCCTHFTHLEMITVKLYADRCTSGLKIYYTKTFQEDHM